MSDGVVSRSVRDTAALFREAERIHRPRRLPPIGDVRGPGEKRLRIAVVTTSVGVTATPEVIEQTLKTAALLEGLGHRVEILDKPPVPDYFKDDFLLYWGFLSTYLVRAGRLSHRGSWQPNRLDNLTLGLARHAARRSHRLPLAIARLRASGLMSARFFQQYDAVLTPTLATATPRIGHLDPTQDFETVIERLMEWVAFTPLQNATGDPAISLPLATSADGLPLGMMLGAGRGQEALLLGLAHELEAAHPWTLLT